MPSQMDRVLERKPWWSGGRLVVPAVVIATILGLTYLVIDRAGRSRLTVDPVRMTTALVQSGDFREYFPFDGTVEPRTSVYLDIEEGGRVEEILVEGGRHVEKGELILRFSNATLRRNSIDTETRLVENLNALRNTQFNLEQNALLLKDQLLDQEHRILDLERAYARYEPLNEDGAIERERFEQTRDDLEYARAKRDLLKERIAREEVLSQQQLAQAEDSIGRLELALELLNRIIESLDVRAPISGFLSSIDAEIGQNINRGQRIGQIDILDEYKISVRIDQYYISRVQVGTPGKFDLDGRSYDVVVEKIYPEVVNDAFNVDVTFAADVPPSLRRGQRLIVELSFSEPSQALTVARGGFQQGGGRWAYVISEDRRSATRTPIRLGRQNPRFVEVLEGLRPGDWIISSSYDAFNEADELAFSEPIELL